MNLSNLKKNSSLDKLKKAVEASSGSPDKKKYVDDRFWTPNVDKAGNGFAVIRFLDSPSVDGEEGNPWVQVWSHGFQGPGGWYIENSLTTIGKADPVSEHNTKLWNTGIEANKEIVRKQKRKLQYYSNILVISDPKNPDNEGKVFLFKYGKKIFDKIAERFPNKNADGAWETHDPEDPDFKKFNPFDFWKGANFKLKVRNFEGQRNYDKSEFADPSPLFDGDDAKIEKVWKASYSLKEFVNAKNFKSYDELKARLDRVLGAGGAERAAAPKIEDEDTPPFEMPSVEPKKKATAESISLDDDDDLSYFTKLAAED